MPELSHKIHLPETKAKIFKSSKQKQKKSKSNFKINSAENYNQLFSSTERKESLNKVNNTAVGSDKIYYQFPKELPKSSINYLLQIYNAMWNSSDIPKMWKQTTVILILKLLKDNTNAKNYRPITFSSCVCKTVENDKCHIDLVFGSPIDHLF